MKTNIDYKTKLINLIIADALQIDNRGLEDFTASLLIQGVKPLTDLSIEDLENEVFDRYTFDTKEIDFFNKEDKAFAEWVINKKVKEYYTGW